MRPRDAEIAGRTALWLVSMFTVVAVPVAVVNLFRDEPVPLPTDLVVAYAFATVAPFMAYVYARLELAMRQRNEMLAHQRHAGVEVFHTSEDFLEKLMEITVDAEAVSTVNLSPARGEHANLDLYFERVHHSLRSRSSHTRSFRSIASLDTPRKLAFLLDRSLELANTGRASFAVFDQKAVGSLPHPLSFHVTTKGGQSFVFVYPPVDLTGRMDSVLIRDERVAQVMLKYFDALWHRSLPLNEGRRVRRQGLERLAELTPSIQDTASFQRLMERAS